MRIPVDATKTILQASTSRYICASCISKIQLPATFVAKQSARRSFATSVPNLEAVPETSEERKPSPSKTKPKRKSSKVYRPWVNQSRASEPAPENPALPDKSESTDLPIRDRLRLWAANNSQQNVKFLPRDNVLETRMANTLIRPQQSAANELDVFRPIQRGMADLDDNVGNSDPEVGLDSRSPGDLVELRAYGSRLPVFAVYLGYFGSRHHYYASHGKWIMTVGFGTFFTASNFATLEEIKPILAEIPRCSTPDEFEKLRDADQGPSREIGAAMIKKLNDVTADAERIYQNNIDRLDNARWLLADAQQVKYLSLFEIADIVLSPSWRSAGSFPASALYAVHTALYRDEITFRPLSPTSDSHRREHIYEVYPTSFVNTVNSIAWMVRHWSDMRGRRPDLLANEITGRTNLGPFVKKARKVVEQSRKGRAWTPHGMISSSIVTTYLPRTEWTEVDKRIIQYLEWWATYDLFEPSSRFSAYGSLLLRALELYDEASLNQSTAWTFLQEIGHVQPWEVPSRYKVRFPKTTNVPAGGISRAPVLNPDASMRDDIAAGYRVPTKDSVVFCIDGPGASLIDDGISLETTDKKDEFWIHVHASDPGSGIKPDSELRTFMELIPENIYLQGHFQGMMSYHQGGAPRVGQSMQDLAVHYSLRAGSPALTFSAKVNESGDILDYKIKPSELGKVVYLDPGDVAEFCNESFPPSPAMREITVGLRPSQKHSLNRAMKAANDLDDAGKTQLLTLHRLAGALQAKRVQKGAWPYFFPNADVQVLFHNGSPPLTKGEFAVPPDPYIKVHNERHSQCSVVGNTMVLAGEIAARWCDDRDIPAPYRKDAKSAQNFEAALRYATEELYPQIQKGIVPTVDQRAQLTSLTGGINLSTSPGPYFIMGLDMYAKATSPLRRFGDLILHWQIHAALAYERQVRRPIDPSRDDLDRILPFPESELVDTLGLLQMRERMAKVASSGTRDWIYMALIRAWRFEKSAPETFRFTVGSVWKSGLLGTLDWCGLRAIMGLDGLNKQVLLKDVKYGDRFEVALEDVNMHSREIHVKAIEYLGGEEQEQLADPSL